MSGCCSNCGRELVACESCADEKDRIIAELTERLNNTDRTGTIHKSYAGGVYLSDDLLKDNDLSVSNLRKAIGIIANEMQERVSEEASKAIMENMTTGKPLYEVLKDYPLKA